MHVISSYDNTILTIKDRETTLAKAYYYNTITTLKAINTLTEALNTFSMVNDISSMDKTYKAIIALERTGAMLTEKSNLIVNELYPYHKGVNKNKAVDTINLPTEDLQVSAASVLEIDIGQWNISLNTFIYKGETNKWIKDNEPLKKNLISWNNFPDIGHLTWIEFVEFREELYRKLKSNKIFYSVNGEVLACIL